MATLGNIFGLGVLGIVGTVIYKVVKRKIKKEVKVYDKIKSPEGTSEGESRSSDDRGAEADNVSTTKVKPKRVSRRNAKRSKLQDTSIKNRKRDDRTDEGIEDPVESLGDSDEELEPIEE